MKVDIGVFDCPSVFGQPFGGRKFEWLVELTANNDHFVTDTVIVWAETQEGACAQAFFTRNIASNWRITEIERA